MQPALFIDAMHANKIAPSKCLIQGEEMILLYSAHTTAAQTPRIGPDHECPHAVGVSPLHTAVTLLALHTGNLFETLIAVSIFSHRHYHRLLRRNNARAAAAHGGADAR